MGVMPHREYERRMALARRQQKAHGSASVAKEMAVSGVMGNDWHHARR